VTALWFEPQDRMGAGALSAYLVSAASATVALALSAGVLPYEAQTWSAAAWYFHRFGNVLWALPIALGFASKRQLPRLLAGFSIALAGIFYGWEWLPFTSSPSTPIKLTYLVSALAVVLPAWVSQLRARSRDAA